ncbi:terminase [Nocardia sp. Marseille-Q1738]
MTTGWPKVRERLVDMGVEFDPWQAGISQIALGKRANGKYAATVGGVVLSIPRQVGKTFTVGFLIFALCLEFPGTRVIWTSHHARTTTNTFRSMQGMVQRPRIAPHLAPNGIRTANGEQEIRFQNRSIVMFGAREQGFGRGMDAIDIEVFDEAQILSIKALEDMVPATNQARHPHGALLFFIGTPPRPTDPGEAFTTKRARALSGKSEDQAYIEFSADSDADPDDRAQWSKANPSYPVRTPLEAMLRMRENIPDEASWLREAMGIWEDYTAGAVISTQQWNDLKDPASQPKDPVAFGVYLSQDRSVAAIAVAGRREDWKIHVEIVPAKRGGTEDSLPGTAWIAPRLKELADGFSPCAVVIDSFSAAASLIPAITDAGVEVVTTGASDMARACGQFYDAVIEDEIRHLNAKPLNTAVCSGKKRPLRDAWAWDRKDPRSDITQLVAATLAVHGLIEHGPEDATETEVWGFWE